MSAFALEAGPDPLLGKVLQDRYRVVRKLGEGGMGAVYEGEHLLIKKRVAIKVLHPQFATSPEIVARFHQEALAATAIGHEHIVEVNDMGRTPDGAIFMVLEFLMGTDFAGLLEKEQRISIGRVVHIVAQVCDGVQAAHEKGIVHRDLKPENIFVVKRKGDAEFVKVLDFGISKFQDSAAGGHAATKTGSIMGTAYYMSPEQAQGKKSVDHRTDVWAIGVILFKALAGSYPFEDDAFPMLLVKICTENPPRIQSLRPDVPNELAAIIDRCLTRDVDRRVQSCAELRALIAPFETLTAPPPPQSAAAFAATLPSNPDGSPRAVSALASSLSPAVRAIDERAITPETLAASGFRATPSMPRWIPVTGFVVVASLVAGGAIWAFTQPPKAEVSPIATPMPVTIPTAASAAPAIPGQVLEFIVSPTEAAVLIDGRPVSTGTDHTLSEPVVSGDTALHELRIEARGFRTRVENIRLSYHQRIVVALDPGTGIDDRRGTASPPATTGRRGRTPSAQIVPSGGIASPPSETAGNGRTTPRETAQETPRVVETTVARPATPVVVVPAPDAPRVDGVVTPPPPRGLKRLRTTPP